MKGKEAITWLFTKNISYTETLSAECAIAVAKHLFRNVPKFHQFSGQMKPTWCLILIFLFFFSH